MRVIKREKFVDVAKGIGIILVILGHLNTGGQYSRNIIYAFHMPFFFIISGALSRTKIGFKEYFIKNFKRLYVPFLVFCIVDIIPDMIHTIFANTDVRTILLNSISSLTGLDLKISNRPIWFLFVLFVVRIVHYFINERKVLKILIAVLGFFAAMASQSFEHTRWCLWIVALPCLSFYILGDILKRHILALAEKVDRYTAEYLVITVILLGVFVFGSIKNVTVDMSVGVYGNCAWFIFNALAGTFILLVISSFVAESEGVSKALAFLGKNTIIILVTHYYICRIFLPKFMAYFGLSQYLYSYITQGIVLIFVILLMIPTILLSNKYLKFVFGKSNCANRR